MLYLHCGWPKTGTTTLQAALVRHQDRLAASGIVYPERWRRKVDGSHNDLVDVVRTWRDSNTGLDEFKRFLEDQTDDVLLASESLTLWLLRDEMREDFVEFLAAAQEVGSVRCIWTIRRFDELAHSLYMYLAMGGVRLPPPAEFMEEASPDRLFAGMREVEDGVGEVAYVKYDSAGGHHDELLDALGLPVAVAGDVARELAEATRLNTSRTHKQFVAAVNADAVSTRAGRVVEKQVLLDAFDRGGFRFRDDGACELAGDAARRDLHGKALMAAQERGFAPYGRFFAQATVAESRSPQGLEVDILSDEDLRRLVAHLEQPRPSAVRTNSASRVLL